MVDKTLNIITTRMPHYFTNESQWAKWRLSYEGGPEFRERYLEKFNQREEDPDFKTRKEVTPIPVFAKAAISDIRNAIFQRMTDIVRRGGSKAYHQAVAGFQFGVDRRGSSMNAFIGRKVLEELLVMGKVGVYVDAPQVAGDTLADVGAYQPYLYAYRLENILSFSCNEREDASEFQSILLRDETLSYNRFNLPDKVKTRYRHLWIDDEDGLVRLQFYNEQGAPVDQYNRPSGPIELKLRRIPFVLFDIGDSLMKDVCEYQIAMLNLASSDVNYALRANFPFYTEMRDLRDVGGHLKHSSSEGEGKEIKTGVTQGRYYDKGMERPAFISPPSEPLQASMALQEKYEKDIRKLVNLAVQTLATRQSAEAKSLDNQGLESGLAFIGLVLETGERQIAAHWSTYENSQSPIIKYPEQYNLKGEADRIAEATDLSKVITKTPSKKARKELWKTVCGSLLGGKVSPDVLLAIYREIDEAKFTTSDPDIIIAAAEAGLVGEQTGSEALGFPDGEHLKARSDHIDRLTRIAKAQGILQPDSDPRSRGIPDLSANQKAGKEEKAKSRDRTFDADNRDRTRGGGKS